MPKKKTKKTEQNPYKDVEFEEFIKFLGDETVCHWYEIAEALGVTADTVIRWKKHPRAVEARRKGFERTLRNMEKAGRKDWRMWREKAKIQGIRDVNEVDITSKGEPIAVNLNTKK